jgi:uncharacterized protein YdeI (YjbR/CyaY-like superfamily)
MDKTLLVVDREQWRRWLEENHSNEREVWLIFYKKHTGQPSIPYDDAVEEAICFGWIDSIIKRLDQDRFARKFTVRTNPDKWSELNVKRARYMIGVGKMTPTGLKMIPPGILDGTIKPEPPVKKRLAPMPIELQQRLNQHPQAQENFSKLPPSQQKNYKLWIGTAKKPETRQKRADEALQLLIANKPLGMK